MFLHSCFSFLLNIYKGSQAEIKVPQIPSQLKITCLFLARQSGINQGHWEDAREGRRGADNLFIQIFSHLPLLFMLARLTAWDVTQMLWAPAAEDSFFFVGSLIKRVRQERGFWTS